MLIVARFGPEVIPWVSISLGLLMMLATWLKFQNIIYLIPLSIIIALKNTIGKPFDPLSPLSRLPAS